jgi:hypothetical protein
MPQSAAMSFTPPHTHWRSPDPIEWESMPQASVSGQNGAHDSGITRIERIAIVLVAIAMLLAACWLQ